MLVRGASSRAGWTEFQASRAQFGEYMRSRNVDGYQKIANAFHALGVSLMQQVSRGEVRWAEARDAFEQAYIIAVTHLKLLDTIAPLRRLAECYCGARRYPEAIRHCEQALTVSGLTGEPEEQHGALTHLAQITQAWLGDTTERSPGEYAKRKVLTDQMCRYFEHAHVCVEGMTNTRLTPIKNLQHDANINVVMAIQQRIILLPFKEREVVRLDAITKETNEDPNLYLCQTASRDDLLGLQPMPSYSSNPTPHVRAYGLIAKARTYLVTAERLTLAATSDAVPQLTALSGEILEIHSIETPSRHCNVSALSDVHHWFGKLYEAAGMYAAAITEYVKSVRHLNGLRGQWEHDPELREEVITKQSTSLRSALVVAVKLHSWKQAQSYANQLRRLVDELVSIGRSTSCINMLQYRARSALELATHTQQLVEDKARTDMQLQASGSGTEEHLRHQYSLLHDLRDRVREAIVESAATHNHQFDSFLESELHRDRLETLLNCERRMWRLTRQLRNASVHEAKAGLLLQEGHVLIALAQTTSHLCKSYLPYSPRRDLEIRMVNKYWDICRGWFRRYGSVVQPCPEWEGMVFREQAGALRELRMSKAEVRRLHTLALEAINAAAPRPLFERMLPIRIGLAEAIADDLSGDINLRAERMKYIAMVDKLRVEWRTRGLKCKEHASLELLESQIQDVFEGEQSWPECVGGVCAASTKSIDESHCKWCESTAMISIPPSSFASDVDTATASAPFTNPRGTMVADHNGSSVSGRSLTVARLSASVIGAKRRIGFGDPSPKACKVPRHMTSDGNRTDVAAQAMTEQSDESVVRR